MLGANMFTYSYYSDGIGQTCPEAAPNPWINEVFGTQVQVTTDRSVLGGPDFLLLFIRDSFSVCGALIRLTSNVYQYIRHATMSNVSRMQSVPWKKVVQCVSAKMVTLCMKTES